MIDYALIIKNALFFAMVLSTISCVFSLRFIFETLFYLSACIFLRKHVLLYHVRCFDIEETANMLYYNYVLLQGL